MYENIYPDFIDINNEICEDEFIGFLYKNKDNLIFKRRSDYKKLFVSPDSHDLYCNEKEINYKNKIFIILESPHIEEYFGYKLKKYSGGTTNSRPANGVTGENIDKYFTKIFRDFLIENLDYDGIYSIIIINPVQNQCSLGVSDTKIYRDRMWLNYWLNGGKDNFLNRVEKYKVDFLINCCTTGKHYKIDKANEKYLFDKKTTNLPQYFFEDEYNLKKSDKKDDEFILRCRKYESNGSLTLRGIVEATLEEKFSNEFLEKKYVRSAHPCTWDKNTKTHKFDSSKKFICFKKAYVR